MIRSCIANRRRVAVERAARPRGTASRQSAEDLYVRGRLAVHAHLCLRVPSLEAGAVELCAVFQRPDRGREGQVAESVGGREHSVLVRVGERFDESQGVRGGVLSSVVRLQALQDCARGLADVLHGEEALEVEWAHRRREVVALVGEGADVDAERCRRLFEKSNVRDMPAGFRLKINGDAVWLAVQEPPGVCVEGLEVFACPLRLRPGCF